MPSPEKRGYRQLAFRPNSHVPIFRNELIGFTELEAGDTPMGDSSGTGACPWLRAQIRAACPEREQEFNLALYTGMRRGKQFGLKRSGVDLENAILTVSGKTGQRKIILNSLALAAVQKLLARGSSEFVRGAKREGLAKVV